MPKRQFTMSNISLIGSSIVFPFLQDYVIESVRMKNPKDMRNGKAIIGLLIENERYELYVKLKDGKKEGVGLILRENGTLFMKMMFVNDICEGEVIKKDEYGRTVLRGYLKHGEERGSYEEFNEKGRMIRKGPYILGGRISRRKINEKKDKFEMNKNRDLLNVNGYDDNIVKEGRCFTYEGGRVFRECEYKNGECVRVIREWKGDVMIEYDDNGKRVYEGGWKISSTAEFVREGKGTEYKNDGKRALYIGDWKNGLREGYGSEYKGCYVVYIGEWKNGLRDGMGEEYNEDKVVRSGKWTEGKYGMTKHYKESYGNELSVFGTRCLKGITHLIIDSYCFWYVRRFVLEGLHELKTVRIKHHSFYLNKDIGKGSQCLIRNCDQLKELVIGGNSSTSMILWIDHLCFNSTFKFYEVFELKNLPSLISVQLRYSVFLRCHSVVFESEDYE